MASNCTIREVFRDNFKEEEEILLLSLTRHRFIAFDTEFPGCLEQTPRDADDRRRYADLKSNVERTKLIQAGFTLFEPATASVAGVWQFNVAGFSPKRHPHSPDSIRLLENSGINFRRNSKKGIRITQFLSLLYKITTHFGGAVHWVTFHGLYDAAYLLAAVSGVWKLPPDIQGFAFAAGKLFRGGIFDLKHMAGDFYYMGLEKLAAKVGETRDQGLAHQAGSDSLLTAKVFIRVAAGADFWSYMGHLYGINVQIPAARNYRFAYRIPPRFLRPQYVRLRGGDSRLIGVNQDSRFLGFCA